VAEQWSSTVELGLRFKARRMRALLQGFRPAIDNPGRRSSCFQREFQPEKLVSITGHMNGDWAIAPGF